MSCLIVSSPRSVSSVESFAFTGHAQSWRAFRKPEATPIRIMQRSLWNCPGGERNKVWLVGIRTIRVELLGVLCLGLWKSGLGLDVNLLDLKGTAFHLRELSRNQPRFHRVTSDQPKNTTVLAWLTLRAPFWVQGIRSRLRERWNSEHLMTMGFVA